MTQPISMTLMETASNLIQSYTLYWIKLNQIKSGYNNLTICVEEKQKRREKLIDKPAYVKKSFKSRAPLDNMCKWSNPWPWQKPWYTVNSRPIAWTKWNHYFRAFNPHRTSSATKANTGQSVLATIPPDILEYTSVSLLGKGPDWQYA